MRVTTDCLSVPMHSGFLANVCGIGQHVRQSPCGATAARTAGPYDRGCASPLPPICTQWKSQCGSSVHRQPDPACNAALAQAPWQPHNSHLLPSWPCHSASARSSAGSQLPVRTGSPFTVVGIGMLCRLTADRLHRAGCCGLQLGPCVPAAVAQCYSIALSAPAEAAGGDAGAAAGVGQLPGCSLR